MSAVVVYTLEMTGFVYVVTVVDGMIASVIHISDGVARSVESIRGGHMAIGHSFVNEKARLPQPNTYTFKKVSENYDPFTPY